MSVLTHHRKLGFRLDLFHGRLNFSEHRSHIVNFFLRGREILFSAHDISRIYLWIVWVQNNTSHAIGQDVVPNLLFLLLVGVQGECDSQIDARIFVHKDDRVLSGSSRVKQEDSLSGALTLMYEITIGVIDEAVYGLVDIAT